MTAEFKKAHALRQNRSVLIRVDISRCVARHPPRRPFASSLLIYGTHSNAQDSCLLSSSASCVCSPISPKPIRMLLTVELTYDRALLETESGVELVLASLETQATEACAYSSPIVQVRPSKIETCRDESHRKKRNGRDSPRISMKKARPRRLSLRAWKRRSPIPAQ